MTSSQLRPSSWFSLIYQVPFRRSTMLEHFRVTRVTRLNEMAWLGVLRSQTNTHTFSWISLLDVYTQFMPPQPHLRLLPYTNSLCIGFASFLAITHGKQPDNPFCRVQIALDRMPPCYVTFVCNVKFNAPTARSLLFWHVHVLVPVPALLFIASHHLATELRTIIYLVRIRMSNAPRQC